MKFAEIAPNRFHEDTAGTNYCVVYGGWQSAFTSQTRIVVAASMALGRALAGPSEPGFVAPDVPTFYQLGEQAVTEQNAREPREVRRRQLDHAHVLAQRREW